MAVSALVAETCRCQSDRKNLEAAMLALLAGTVRDQEKTLPVPGAKVLANLAGKVNAHHLLKVVVVGLAPLPIKGALVL